MRKIATLLFAGFFLIPVLSCNHSSTSEPGLAKEMVLDSATIADLPALNLPDRKFLRTASLKSKVGSVKEAVFEVENKTRALGGYVSYSHFINGIQDSSAVAVSMDSDLQVMHYSTTGFLTLRVPDSKLDSLLNAISPLAIMMISRELRADDVSITMLANDLAKERSASAGGRLAAQIDEKGKKLTEIEHAENTLEERQASTNEARIANLRLENAVQYSTITLELYQEPTILYAEKPREKVVKEFQEPFFVQAGEAISGGWQWLKDTLIALTRYWPVILLIILGYHFVAKPLQIFRKIKANKA